MKQSISETDRILSLDVVRGFALLGILLVNILGFGAISALAFNPPLGFSLPSDIWIWGAVELTAEGAMRALFSMLFGAGVLLFLERGEGRERLHFKRTFWLLIFGLLNSYVLMWSGDILFTYALAGFVLYFLRNKGPKGLAILSTVLFACLFAYSAALNFGLEFLRNAADHNAEAAAGWAEFYDMFAPSQAAIKAELAQRTGSFYALVSWSAAAYTSVLLEIIPMLLVWDALVFMCIGMALYRYGVLQGAHSDRFYLVIALVGFGVGLLDVLRRTELYLVVLLIWAFQLWLSPWWLARYRYGPVEWLWRTLTYGKAPQFARTEQRKENQV